MAHQRKSKVPSFVHTFVLDISPAQARVLRVRMEIARQWYNAMLGEARKRYSACVHDPRWQVALSFYRTASKEAKTVFHACKKEHGYSEFALTTLIKDWRQNVFVEHLDQKACQDITVRAFRAHERFVQDRTHKAGKKRRVKFKRHGELDTLSSSGMKIDVDRRVLVWWGLSLPYRLAEKDVHDLEAYVLAIMQDAANICEYGKRITRKTIRGTDKYYLQVTLKGVPYHKSKHHYKRGCSIGVDLGPSALAIATDAGVALVELAPDCARDEGEKRRLQRYMDRSRRATNPECFATDGRCIAKPRHKSKRYRQAEAQHAEIERRLAAKRKIAHNALVHSILEYGSTIYAEKLSLKGWQKGLFGKSLGKRAPGMLMVRLKQQAEASGGSYLELPTAHLKLSQLCHGCGTYHKKLLSERVHRCSCGVEMQRDMYSALLARHYSPEDRGIDTGAVQAAFASLQSGAMGMNAAFNLRGCKLVLVSLSHSGRQKSGSIATVVRTIRDDSCDMSERGACSLSTPSGASIEANTLSLGDARVKKIKGLSLIQGEQSPEGPDAMVGCSQSNVQLLLFHDIIV